MVFSAKKSRGLLRPAEIVKLQPKTGAEVEGGGKIKEPQPTEQQKSGHLDPFPILKAGERWLD